MEEETDFELDAYTARLSSFIRTYYMRRAATCFEMASRNDPSIRGRVVIAFTIQADGTTTGTHVDSNQTGVDSLGACLSTQVSNWRLPPPVTKPGIMPPPCRLFRT